MEKSKLEIMKDYLKLIDEVIENGEYKDDWNSCLHHKVPDWYRNAKFGIFLHWGVYAVPAYCNEWYCRYMYKNNECRKEKNCYEYHVKNFGDPKEFGYKDLVPLFKAEKFDPKEWVELFKDAGAKFVMPVAEHCDGFQMYDSQLSDWCISKMGPCMDTLAMLKKEVEEQNLTFTASSHRAEHYWFMSTVNTEESDQKEKAEYSDMYWPSVELPCISQKDGLQERDVEIDELFLEDWLVRNCEIVDKYRPKIMYFDWWIQVKPLRPYLKKFMAYYYNRAKEWGEDVTINYKNDAFPHTSAVRDIERGQLSDVSPYYWQTDTAVAKYSWCYTHDNEFKEPEEIICDLLDVISKNGSFLLNVGPKADGTISPQDTKILREIGKWMKVNGEGIYDTYPWRKYGEGVTVTTEGHHTELLRKNYTSQDFRFTFKDNNLYAFAMKYPQDGLLRIKSLGKKVKTFNADIEEVEILGYGKCDFAICDDYLTIYGYKIKTNAPVCVKIKIN